MSNKEINFTLIGDGSSDKILINIIKWVLDDLYPTIPNNGVFADYTYHKNIYKKGDIANSVKMAKDNYPYDILFYHRDAESSDKDIIEKRISEVESKISEEDILKTICIVPIRMSEAWLLINKEAIKMAAGNRYYSEPINLPKLKEIESEIDPKVFLQNLLKKVSGKKGRRLNSFNVNAAIHLVAENINDFSPLRKLSAFQFFENKLKSVVNQHLSN